MAAGDRKIRIQDVHIQIGNPVPFQADWHVYIEDRAGVDRFILRGTTNGNFGTPSVFNSLTGAQIRSTVQSAVGADINTPTYDSLT